MGAKVGVDLTQRDPEDEPMSQEIDQVREAYRQMDARRAAGQPEPVNVSFFGLCLVAVVYAIPVGLFLWVVSLFI